MTIRSTTPPLPEKFMHMVPNLAFMDHDLHRNILDLSRKDNNFFANLFRLIELPRTFYQLIENVGEAVISKYYDPELKWKVTADIVESIAQMNLLVGKFSNPEVLAHASESCKGVQMIVPKQVTPSIGVVFFQGLNSNQIFSLTSNREEKEPNFVLHLFESDADIDLRALNVELVSEISEIEEIRPNLSKRYAQIII